MKQCFENDRHKNRRNNEIRLAEITSHKYKYQTAVLKQNQATKTNHVYNKTVIKQFLVDNYKWQRNLEKHRLKSSKDDTQGTPLIYNS